MRRSTPLIVLCLVLSAGACRPERLMHPTVAPGDSDRVLLGSRPDVLYVLDGRILPRAESADVPTAVQNLDPASIQTIEVLKGARARRAYGDAGSSGVVVITTKRGG